MTLDQLRIFVAVAEQEHVTRASYALDMVQSAVSKAIATLEGEVEFRLFDRVGRNIRLTALGGEFRDRAVDLIAHADRLSAWASTLGSARNEILAQASLRSSSRRRAEPIFKQDRSDQIGSGSILPRQDDGARTISLHPSQAVSSRS